MNNYLNFKKLYCYRKTFLKNKIILNKKDKIIIIFKIINVTHKNFYILKAISTKFKFVFKINSLNSKTLKIEFESFDSIKNFLNFCFIFKIIPYIFLPFNIFYQGSKLPFVLFYIYLNSNSNIKQLYKTILKLICYNLLIKIFFINIKLINKLNK